MKRRNRKSSLSLRRLQWRVKSLELHYQCMVESVYECRAVMDAINKNLDIGVSTHMAFEDMLQELFDHAGIEADVERRVLETVVEFRAEDDAADAVYKAKFSNQQGGHYGAH